MRSEVEIEHIHEQQQQSLKSYIQGFQNCMDIQKVSHGMIDQKFGQAFALFGENLEEVSKMSVLQSDLSICQLVNSMLQVIKEMSAHSKALGFSIGGSFNYLKDKSKSLKQLKEDCKSTYCDHKKMLAQVKKEADISTQKVEEIQSRLQSYQKSVCPVEVRQSQQYAFLIHQEKMAKNEERIRNENRKSCQEEFTRFLRTQQSNIEQKFGEFFEIGRQQVTTSYKKLNETFKAIFEITNKFNDLNQTFKSRDISNIRAEEDSGFFSVIQPQFKQMLQPSQRNDSVTSKSPSDSRANHSKMSQNIRSTRQSQNKQNSSISKQESRHVSPFDLKSTQSKQTNKENSIGNDSLSRVCLQGDQNQSSAVVFKQATYDYKSCLDSEQSSVRNRPSVSKTSQSRRDKSKSNIKHQVSNEYY